MKGNRSKPNEGDYLSVLVLRLKIR